jgi:hypothetical protein
MCVALPHVEPVQHGPLGRTAHQRRSRTVIAVQPISPQRHTYRPLARPAVAGVGSGARSREPLFVREQLSLLGPLLLGRSVDAVPQVLKLGNVSLHQVQSGKTHELRTMNARPRLASARASASLGSVASASTLPIMSVSSLASVTGSGMGAGSPHVPGAGPGSSCGGL